MNHYDPGQPARLYNGEGFINPNVDPPALYDPTVVQLKWRINLGPWTTLVYGSDDIVKIAVGLYMWILDTTNLWGQVDYIWIGDPDGTIDPVGQALEPNSLYVNSA